MPETALAADRSSRPGLAARLGLALLPWLFLAFWAGLLWLLGRTLGQLAPAALNRDPAALLLGLTLGPMTIHLAQALFYLPRKPSRPPVFLGLLESPLSFLPLAGPGRLEAGPAFFAAAVPGDQARILAGAEARLKLGSRAGRLGLLLESRNPLDLALRVLARRPWPLAAPARLLSLLTSPTRQLMRLCGFLFFKADQAWAAHQPMENLARYKRRLAWDLWRRARALDPSAAEEDEAGQVRRLTRLRIRLAGLHQNPGYGATFGEPWPEAETGAATGEPDKIWLAPRYRGAFADLPATLYAKSPALLFAPGRPEPDLGIFYPLELALEAEDAALLAGEGEFLAGLLSDRAEEGLIRLDGRLQPAWDLAAELSAVEAQYDRHLKRIFTHHARTRAAHLAKAKDLGQGWPEILRDWGALLWLAENGRLLLTRARDDLQATATDSAAGRPAEFFPVYASARPAVSPAFPREAAEKFHAVWADLRERLADLDLPTPADLAPPTKLNWPAWQAAWPKAWAGLDRALAELRDRALTGLLTAEDQVAKGQAEPAPAFPWTSFAADLPAPPPEQRPQPPRVYYPAARLKVGPVRSALAALVLALLVWQGWSRGLSPVTVYNGFSTAVTVTANGQSVTVPPFGHRTIRLRPGAEYEFTAALDGQTLESFRQRLASRPAREIYNVAGAAPLMEWWFPRAERPGESLESFLGRPRWLVTRATAIFQEPADGRRALVLSGYGNASPAEMLAPFPDQAERTELARLHAGHTPVTDPRFQAWLDLLPEEERAAVLLERLSQGQAEAATEAEPPPDAPDLLELVDGWPEAPPPLPD